MAGRSIIVVSIRATQELSDDDLRLVIAHEMAHIKRRDHWFRWIEWVALICLWWNPVMWWARNQLRISEEMACDDLVLESTAPEVHRYGNALLNMAELNFGGPPQMAGRSIIVVSIRATQELSDDDLRLVIAHEMAHIKRRDHWFRWIEWVALICLWWNPVMWWARNQLRISEEMACDDLVLESTAPEVHRYGNALLNMAELLTTAAVRPPVVASAINSGGSLEQRMKMMIVDKTWKVSTSMRMAIVAFATCVFPLGVVYAQEEALERRLAGIKEELKQAVEAGEHSKEDAVKKFNAVRRELVERTERGYKEALERRLVGIKQELKQAVEAGEHSKEDAVKKFNAVRRELVERTEGGDKEALEQGLVGIKQDLKRAVEAGKHSKEDAEKKFNAVRRELVERTEGGDKEALERRLAGIKQKLKQAVEAGEHSKEDAVKKFNAVRRELVERTEGDDKEALERRLVGIKQELKQAVEAGEHSKEDAVKKFNAVRRELVERTERGDRK
jgi:beta-lactamase regulating signal transducer with metallopeptidase domain